MVTFSSLIAAITMNPILSVMAMLGFGLGWLLAKLFMWVGDHAHMAGVMM